MPLNIFGGGACKTIASLCSDSLIHRLDMMVTLYALLMPLPCLLQIAADNAVFGQTGPKVGSFDAGYGSSHMVRLIGNTQPPTSPYAMMV